MRLALALAAVCCLAAPAATQDAQVPAKVPVAPTAPQLERLKAGVRLHDQGQYAQAIAIYEAVLGENADCVVAMAELATTLNAKGDNARAIDVATRGLQYQSPQVPSFYMLLGSAYDDLGDLAKALDAYERGLAIAPTALLHYNIAVTLARAQREDEAKEHLKQAALLDPNHATSQLQLGKLWLRHGYTSQGVLALSRFLVLEPGSQRTGEVFRAWLDALRRDVTVGADGKMTMGARRAPDTAEGDFTRADLMIGIGRTASLVGAAGKTEAQQLIAQLDGWFKLLDNEQVTDRSAFAWRYYVPYFVELQKKGYTELFVYWVSQRSDLGGVREWVADAGNRQRVNAFLQWTQSYPWPKTRPGADCATGNPIEKIAKSARRITCPDIRPSAARRAPITSQNGRFICLPVCDIGPRGPSLVPWPVNSAMTRSPASVYLGFATLAFENAAVQPCMNSLKAALPLKVTLRA